MRTGGENPDRNWNDSANKFYENRAGRVGDNERMASNRTIVIFDNSPMDEARWIENASAQAGVKYVSNDAITTELGKDPKAREAMNATPRDHAPHPELGPHFLKALEKTIAEKKILSDKLALQSVNWIDYGLKPACVIIDLDPLNEQLAIGRKSQMREEDVKKYEQLFGTRMQETAKKAVSQDRILVLPAGASEAQKAELAAAHIKKFVK